MFEVGRIVYKIAGRDSNKVAVIVEVLDDRYVLIDGNTRRKKVNVSHIEPTQKTVDVKKGASSEIVFAALEKAGFSIDKKGESRKTPARKIALKAVKTKTVSEKTSKSNKKEAKSQAPKTEVKVESN